MNEEKRFFFFVDPARSGGRGTTVSPSSLGDSMSLGTWLLGDKPNGKPEDEEEMNDEKRRFCFSPASVVGVTVARRVGLADLNFPVRNAARGGVGRAMVGEGVAEERA